MTSFVFEKDSSPAASHGKCKAPPHESSEGWGVFKQLPGSPASVLVSHHDRTPSAEDEF